MVEKKESIIPFIFFLALIAVGGIFLVIYLLK